MSLSFVVLGALVTALGARIGLTQDGLAQIGAVLMVLFGAVLIVPTFARSFVSATAGMAAGADTRMDNVAANSVRGQFLGGLLLGTVWSPCIGPTLGVAIALASQGQNLGHMTLTAATALVPATVFADGFVDYAPGAIQSALAAGQTVFVDYSAVWCSTCHRQERVVNALRSQNPTYDAAMTFIKVDWEEYSRHEVTTSRAIPRRSTLIVLRGDQELGRIVAGTSESRIRGLMDRGL